MSTSPRILSDHCRNRRTPCSVPMTPYRIDGTDRVCATGPYKKPIARIDELLSHSKLKQWFRQVRYVWTKLKFILQLRRQEFHCSRPRAGPPHRRRHPPRQSKSRPEL